MSSASNPASERALRAGRLLITAVGDIVRPDLAVGVDIVDIPILGRQLEGDLGRRFEARVFTSREIADCRGQVSKFASRWAIKEAVVKAIGTGFRDGLRPSMIEVVKMPAGEISVSPPSPEIQWPHLAHLWVWSVSAAHENDIAIAIAIAQRNQGVPNHQGGNDEPE